MKEVVPFVCHLCKGKFEAEFGGMCHHCRKPTCSKHLKKIAEKKDSRDTYFCDECLKTTGAEVEKKKKRWYEKKIL